MFKVIGLALIAGVVAFGAYTAQGNGEMMKVNGHATSPSLNLDINISAVKTKGGNVSGQSVIPGNFKGKVTEVAQLEAPAGERNYWCVKLNVEGNEEINSWLWYVKDVNNGADEISYAAGRDLSCSNAGYPVQPFEPVSKGDFKAWVK